MAQLALLGLQLILALVSWLREKGQLQAGADQEIAKASAAILLKTESAKAILAQVTAMTDAQVDEALKQLEPK